MKKIIRICGRQGFICAHLGFSAQAGGTKVLWATFYQQHSIIIMFRGFDIRPEERVILTARIRQRVKEMLPAGWQIRQVVEVPCSDAGCPLRITRIDVTDPAGEERSWSLHAPLSLVTAKEVAQLLEKHVPPSSTPPQR